MANKSELKTIVVFTEGQSSEPDYINALKRLPHISDNVSLNIEIRPEHGVPVTLVTEAKEYSSDVEVDEVWCVFDVEWPRNHPHLKEALKTARDNGIRLAISNPCFEIWLIMHYSDCGAWLDTAQAESRSRGLDGRSGKGLDGDIYMPLRGVAAGRAKRLGQRHERNGTEFPNDNPSSGMHHLLEAIGCLPATTTSSDGSRGGRGPAGGRTPRAAAARRGAGGAALIRDGKSEPQR